MGACCSKKSDGEDRIRQQIEKTIVEQQKIKEQEVLEQEEEEQQIQIQCLSASGRSQTNQTENYNLLTQPGNDEVIEKDDQPKTEKTKKKKTDVVKEDFNYFKKSDHVLGIKSLVVELINEGEMRYYKISILVNSKDLLYNVTLFGTLTTQNDFKYFRLKPQKYEDAAKYSRFYTFFSNDNYFNANRECKNNFNAFDKLLYVDRSLQVMKDSNLSRLSKRQSTIMDKIAIVNSTHQEMLEIITVVDVEQQSRFIAVLFHLLLQQYHPSLEQSLIFITSATFLFERPPQFDQPNVYRMALFYDKLDYSLKDLQNLFKEQNMELSHLLHKKLGLNLIKILYNCYSQYLYRLNITLATVYYVSKNKAFKLECFGRIKSLIPFGQSQDLAEKGIEEKKMRVYFRAFKKDFYAVSDLIVYFKNTKGMTYKQIQGKRRKFLHNLAKGEDMADDENNYLNIIDQLFTDQNDRYLLEFIRLGVYANQIQSLDKTLSECLPIIESLQKQINEIETKIEQEKEKAENQEDQQVPKPQEESEDSIELENVQLLETFQFDFNIDYPTCSKNTDKLTKNELVYKELLYSSLTFESQFNSFYSQFKKLEKTKLQDAYVEILNAFYQIKQMNDDSWQYKLEQVSEMMKRPIDLLNSIYEDSIDHFHVTVLFYILTLSHKKPIPMLNALQRCINKQLEWKISADKKFRSHNSPKGIIEQKKHIMLQLMYAQSYLNSHNYFSAVQKIQKVIGFQLKNNHQASLFYGYSLLVSGEIQKESLQPVSAMLNLEMSQVIYNSFFPDYKTIEEIPDTNDKSQAQAAQKFTMIRVENLATNNKSKLEQFLGLSYFDIHDQENSLKCLKVAQTLLLRSYHMFSDEVIVVVIKQLHLFVLQDDIGAAMKIALDYATKMNRYYREGKTFKRRIIAKFQFIISNIFEFNGQLLSALRYIERSNRTFTNSKGNNFIIQMHYQAKKLQLIQKLKEVFVKIKNKQNLRQENDLSLFQTLSEHMSQAFLSQFYKQRFVQKSSLLLEKFGMKLIKIQVLLKYGFTKKAVRFTKKLLKVLNKNKKDELYALLTDKLAFLDFDNKKLEEQLSIVQGQIEINERYLQFPTREYQLLKCLITLFILYGKKNDSKQIQETYSRIQQLIDDFFEILQWKNLPSKQSVHSMNNKFEILLKKGKVSMLYAIQAILEQIEYFNTVKKNIFGDLHEPKKLMETSMNLLKEFEEFQENINQGILKKKYKCVYGQASMVTIQTQQVSQVELVKGTLNSIQIEQKQTETDLNLTENNTKIVLDVRTIQEIMISKRKERQTQVQQEQAQSTEKKKQKINRQATGISSSNVKSQKLNPFQNTIMKKSKK